VNLFKRAALFVGVLAVAGCVSTEAQIAVPDRIEADCGSKQARTTAIESILTSTDDAMGAHTPTEAEVREAISARGGLIAHWKDQPLILPRTASRLGEPDKYVHVKTAVIVVVPDDAKERPLDMFVHTPAGDRWIELRAFDHQNPCVEGHREG